MGTRRNVSALLLSVAFHAVALFALGAALSSSAVDKFQVEVDIVEVLKTQVDLKVPPLLHSTPPSPAMHDIPVPPAIPIRLNRKSLASVRMPDFPPPAAPIQPPSPVPMPPLVLVPLKATPPSPPALVNLPIQSPKRSIPPPSPLVLHLPDTKPEQQAKLLEVYFAAVRARIEAAKKYPRYARRKGIQGEAVIRLSLTPTGKLMSASIERSSGSKHLDNAVVAAVKGGSPYPVFPKEAGKMPASFKVAVVFKLQ